MSDVLRYDRLAEALSSLGFTQEAAEYHGALCGALCVRPAEEIDPLDLLESTNTAGENTAGAEQVLRHLCGQSLAAFTDAGTVLSPLLPDDEESLPRRVRALSAWCEGFLYGISTGRPIEMKRCTPEFKEILRDFTEFTHAGVDDGENVELEETAYAELIEYIRVGAQLVYLELHACDADAGVTFH
ncbi:MAG: UPF0149 family protein [Nevskiales bacterium]|nr:UPF0149 family protein [Nevskiales bacterium]